MSIYYMTSERKYAHKCRKRKKKSKVENAPKTKGQDKVTRMFRNARVQSDMYTRRCPAENSETDWYKSRWKTYLY